MAAKVWVVASGKGGVGKTFISSSLGITLAKLKHSVLLVDFDCSGANLHTALGMKPQEKCLSNYFESSTSIKNLIIETPFPRVSFIQGFWNSWISREPTVDDAERLLNDCRHLPYDYIIFDLGSGARPCYLNLFNQADEKFLVTNPEPTSIEKTYRFIESHFLYSIQPNATPESFNHLKDTLTRYQKASKKGPFSFRSYLKQEANIQPDFFEELEKNPIRLIINSSRGGLDQDLGYSIRSVCNKYYDLAVDYTGSLEFDNAVWQSVKEKSHVLISKPFTPLAGAFLSMGKRLTEANFQSNLYKAVV